MKKLSSIHLRAFLFIGLLVVAIGIGLVLSFNAHAPHNVEQPAYSASTPIAITINTKKSIGTASTRIGATYEQHGAEYSQDASAKTKFEKTISSSLSLQNRHVIGFGADNLWTDPTNRDPKSWHWENLDAKIAEMRKSSGKNGAEITLTLGMAPNWMTTENGLKGADGKTLEPKYQSPKDYPDKNGDGKIDKYADNPSAEVNLQTVDEIEAAPDPWFENDFAYMSAQVAKRYPDVKIFQVWNELKGMYNQKDNRWDYERYTRLYNKVYKAVKKVRKDVKIGGPYVSLTAWADKNDAFTEKRDECRGDWGALDARDVGSATKSSDSVLSYWLKHKTSADFITVDFGTQPTRGNTNNFDEFSTDKITAVEQCIRSVADENGDIFSDAKSLPIGIAEFYPNINSSAGSETQRAAVEANGISAAIKNDYDYALLWDIQSMDCNIKKSASPLTLLSNIEPSRCADAKKRAKASALVPILQNVKTRFSPGTELYKSSATSQNIETLAGSHGTMLVNKTAQTQSVRINNCTEKTLKSFDVVFLDPESCDAPKLAVIKQDISPKTAIGVLIVATLVILTFVINLVHHRTLKND